MHAKGDKKLKWNLFGRVAFLQRKTSRQVAAHTTISYKVKVKKKCQHFEIRILLEEQITGSVKVVVFPQCSIFH